MGVTLKESTVNQSLRVLKAAHVALRSGAWEVVVAPWTHPPKRAGNTGALFRGTAMLGLLSWAAFCSPAWVPIEWFELDTSRKFETPPCMPWDGSRPMPSPCKSTDSFECAGEHIPSPGEDTLEEIDVSIQQCFFDMRRDARLVFL